MSENAPIKIGILFSQAGSMAVSEHAHIEGALLACDEINKSGGINGHQIEPLVRTPEGDDRAYAELATELLLKENVRAIFGCCLSTSRKAVLAPIERFNGILFYPSVYEGFEYSPNVIYGGAVPNQIVVPLLDYIFSNYGRRVALIGSDTLYAREVNRIVKEFMADSEGEIVLEEYLPFGLSTSRCNVVFEKLSHSASSAPSAIISTVVGEDSVVLYQSYNLERHKAPIASLTTTESELRRLSPERRTGHISAAPYFGSLDTQLSRAFVARYQARFGQDRVPGVYTEVTYSQVHIFANALRLCPDGDTDALLGILSGAVFHGPRGDIYSDVDTNHFTVRPLIGSSQSDGTFKIVWKGPSAIKADPYLVAYDRSV